ncbi:hypothetical protein GBAR_LOCUS15991 [Geodia barretti]|uniref:Uncharacterized protein n=1 Tax=Geodia barretti TaxID=519541 RepID=A0AA35WVG6_GEOBA|nr:hypothetical protein GBAR_LOCUS15991 [Geodia barretti]
MHGSYCYMHFVCDGDHCSKGAHETQRKKGRKVAKSSAASSQRVAMEKNMAYELDKPQHRRKGHRGPQQYCQTPNPIYEDLK